MRLTNAGFRSMPRFIATASVVFGACVVVFGLALPFLQTSPATDRPQPRITLEPADRSSTVRDAVHGVIRLPDGSPASDVAVKLTPLFGGEGDEELSTRTADDGRFLFSGVDVTPGTPFVVDARYDGATFPSDVLRFGRPEEDPVRLVVAETTKSANDISLDVESIALVGDAQGLQAVHALTVHNGGDRAYVGGLHLPLLPGANAIDPRDGLDRRHLDVSDGVLVSMSPVPPGRTDITYTYVAAMPRSGLVYEHEAVHPVERFEMLVGGDLEATTHEGLSRAGEVVLGPRGEERTYRRYEAAGLDAGDNLRIVVSPAASSPALTIAAIAAAALVAVGLVAFPLVRRRRRESPSPATPEPVAAE